MNLSGSLSAFRLTDVLTLLAMTRKTGVLRLLPAPEGGRAAEAYVSFRDGLVTGAATDGRSQALARRLIGAGLVDESGLVAAIERARHTDIGLGRALLDAGAIDPGLLVPTAEQQIVDAVAALLEWSEGDFEFDPSSADRDDVGVALPLETVVTAAGDRVRLTALLAGYEGTAVGGAPGVPPTASRAAGTRGPGASERSVTSSRVTSAPAASVTPRVPDTPASLVDGPSALRSEPAVPAQQSQPAHTEQLASVTSLPAAGTATVGATAVETEPVLGRDPGVNRTMLLRLIAGVKGL